MHTHAHTHILAHIARMKNEQMHRKNKTKKAPASRTPELPFDKTETQKMHHSNIFWHVFIQQVSLLPPLHPRPGTIHWHKARALKFFFPPQPGAKLRNLFQHPGESSSLKYITTPVTWRPTYRHTIYFLEEKKNKTKHDRRWLTYTL